MPINISMAIWQAANQHHKSRNKGIERMTDYGCGHDAKPVYYGFVVDKRKRLLFIRWKYSKGIKGDRSKCFDCYLKEFENVSIH